MSEAFTGYGSKLQVGSGTSPQTFSDVAEVYEVTVPQASSDLIEVTHYQSPNRTKEYISGLTDYAEFTATMNFLPGHATQNPTTGLIGAQASGVIKTYKVVMPDEDNTAVTFKAVVRTVAPALPINDRATMAVTFKPTGALVWSTTP